MNANITIQTTSGTVSSIQDIDFPLIEMPYMCRGYRFNGSSTAQPADLNNFWNLVDKILAENSLVSTQYITLDSITLTGS
jgi:hypothetical protein